MSKQSETYHLTQNLLRLGANLEKIFNRALVDLNLTQQQFIVLNEIKQSRLVCASSIISELAYEKSNMSKIIQKLGKLGYIETIVEPQDKRVKRVRLTFQGEAIWQECLNRLNHENEQIFHSVSHIRARRLRQITRKLYQLIAGHS